MVHGSLFASTEIEKFQKGEGKDEEKYIDVVINKNMKLGQKVLIPVKQFPKVRHEPWAAAVLNPGEQRLFGSHTFEASSNFIVNLVI